MTPRAGTLNMELSRTRARLYHKSSHSRRPQDTAQLPPVKWWSFPDLLIGKGPFYIRSSNMSKLRFWIGTKIHSTLFRSGTSVNGIQRLHYKTESHQPNALKSRPKGRKTKRQSKPRCLQHDPTLNLAISIALWNQYCLIAFALIFSGFTSNQIDVKKFNKSWINLLVFSKHLHVLRPVAHGPHEPWHSGWSQGESWQSENLPKPRRELKTLENTSVVFWDFNMNNLRILEERNHQLSGPRLLSYKM